MPDVLIFEDDPWVADLAGEVLRQKGLTVGHYLSGAGVLQLIQEGQPKLVVLDIMMPGLDGLSACRAIRSNPSTRSVKIVVLTAKDSTQDRETAQRYGADVFLNKPFNASIFARTIGQVLGFPQDPSEATVPKPPAPPISVTILPGAAVLETASLWVLLDAGAGLKQWVETQKKAPQNCWLLLSRYHQDAVSEISVGSTILAAGCRVKVGGPDDPESQLQRLAPRICSGRSTPLLYPQREGEFQLEPGVVATTRYAHHPGLTLAYRVDLHDRCMVYCPAHEVRPDPENWNGHEMNKFRVLFSGADFLLQGFRRSLADLRPDDELGQAAWEPAVDLAAECGVRHLVLWALPGAFPAPGLQDKVEARLTERGLKLHCTVAHPAQRFVL